MEINWTNIIGLLAILAPLIWAVCQHYSSLKQEQQAKEFDNYHRLIKELVQPANPDELMYLDRQMAIVYELRNFKRYYPVTYRILKGLKKQWEEKDAKYQRLLNEISLTIAFLEKRKVKRD